MEDRDHNEVDDGQYSGHKNMGRNMNYTNLKTAGPSMEVLVEAYEPLSINSGLVAKATVDYYSNLSCLKPIGHSVVPIMLASESVPENPTN